MLIQLLRHLIGHILELAHALNLHLVETCPNLFDLNRMFTLKLKHILFEILKLLLHLEHVADVLRVTVGSVLTV